MLHRFLLLCSAFFSLLINSRYFVGGMLLEEK